MNIEDKSGFLKVWENFYDEATSVANREFESSKTTLLSKHRSQMVNLLDEMTKLIFGLDEGKKSIAINHGTGSIELALRLVSSARVLPPRSLPIDDNTEILLFTSALKAIKSCVVRNPSGRTRCRSAGLFEFLSSVLDYCLKTSAPAALINEVLTTLAATCLGDDLNALQGTLQLRHFIETISTKHGNNQNTSLKQTITYLIALFDVIEKERHELILFIEKEKPDFFNIVTISEKKYRMGQNFLQLDKFHESETCCTSALSTVEPLLTHTSLLENLICNLYKQRSTARLALDNCEGALSDVDTLLNNFKLSMASVARTQTQRAEALEGLGRKVDVTETSEKASILPPNL